jgi:hypothetical protein
MYKNRGIFEYIELPYDIKSLIVNKCMERNSGVFNNIEEFRQFQSRIGLDPSKHDNIEVKESYEGIYDNKIVFVFYSKSSSIAKPGKGSGEKIPVEKIKQFIPLSKYADWRRKLDDSWIDVDDPLVIDKKKWASVSHYLWGLPLKDKFPEKYALFSLNSGNKIGKDYDAAKKEHVRNGVELDESELTTERENALRVKFTKPELKEMLLATHSATLLRFENKNSPKEDKLLMFIRKELRKA